MDEAVVLAEGAGLAYLESPVVESPLEMLWLWPSQLQILWQLPSPLEMLWR